MDIASIVPINIGRGWGEGSHQLARPFGQGGWSCPAPSPQPSPARGEGVRSPFEQGRYCYFNGIALREVKGDSHQIWRIQIIQATVTSLWLFLRSSTGPNRPFQPQSLGRVSDPVRVAEGPTAIDAATQRRHFGFRLRLVGSLQPIGGARQRPRREDGKRRVFALHTAQTRPTPRFRSLHEVCTQGVPLHVANDLVEVVFCFHRETLV